MTLGIGDDCAILRIPAAQDSLVTTDFSLEGIHFRRDWHPPESVGHRCLARGLSDIAAMGGEPLAAFLSLALPRDLPQGWVARFARSLISVAKRFGVTLAGGDTAQSPGGILADIIVVGAVPKGKALLRSGARAGDRIFVSGELGGSAAAVQQMTKRKKKVTARDYPRHFYPEPRIDIGRALQTWRTCVRRAALGRKLTPRAYPAPESARRNARWISISPYTAGRTTNCFSLCDLGSAFRSRLAEFR